jgi:tetratricopeptide (TPR) repeat protein
MTGSPLLSAVGLLIFYWLLDRYTLGVLPDPFRFLSRLRKRWKLENTLQHMPHDRKTRGDLAEIYIERKQYAEAVTVLRPNLEAGDDDLNTVFTMGVACLGAGHTPQGEKLLAHALELQPQFRSGEIYLALGRFRLERQDFAGAKQALEELLNLRKGSIEGRVLLSRALEGLKDDGAAALMRDQAWEEYVAAPGFQRRRERRWAWRARPSRPLIYLALAVVGFWLLVLGIRQVNPSAGMQRDEYYDSPY